METAKLTLEHKQLLYDRLRAIAVPLSEYSFANVYLFRRVHQYELVQDREVFIRGCTYDGHSFLMPTVDITRLEDDYLARVLTWVDFLFPVPEEWLAQMDTGRFRSTSGEGDTDYVCSTEKMSNYSGRKLHKKRNLLRQFERRYDHQACPLVADRMEDARAILEQWREEMNAPPEETDYEPCREAMELYEELVLCGVIYYAEGEPAGFIIGDELNEETFALHFAKAKRRVKGIYEYMYNALASLLTNRYNYMNFEQDLGISALRIAKSSYDPDILLKKYRVALRAKG